VQTYVAQFEELQVLGNLLGVKLLELLLALFSGRGLRCFASVFPEQLAQLSARRLLGIRARPILHVKACLAVGTKDPTLSALLARLGPLGLPWRGRGFLGRVALHQMSLQ
jgi:hypothetical protein